MLRARLAITLAISCYGQDPNQDPKMDFSRRLERELHGGRLDLESGFFYSTPASPNFDPSGNPANGVISATALSHKIPKRARQAFDRSGKHSDSGDYYAAAADLEQAIAIDPNFVEARANLGAQYLRLGRVEDARRELQRVLERDRNIAAAHMNLTLVFLEQGDPALAVTHGRIAVKLAPASHRAHYNLGLALGQSPSTLPESLEHLRIAAERLPQAKREIALVEMLLSRE